MNTEMKSDNLDGLEGWHEEDVEDLAGRFVRIFHRTPDTTDLRRFRRGRASLLLRLPLRSRRTIAATIASV